MTRWKMNKLGFLNFWLYDLEEFPIHDGHILLRGSNAAGKSITTQSFIPFILDGDKRPQRLDPFGSRERRMEYYLLGDNEREESTGYLYLEFRKSDVEEYRTVGVGMRAQRGKGIDFWGFCLCDGRRVCNDGLRLYERLDSRLLPVSKQKLRGLIGNPDCWAESQTKYKEMVNRMIFGFEDIRQFDQLIDLLIQVRAPKLSKDYRPSRVKEILNESLQVLTDDDLSAMVSTMEQMDDLEDTLRGYRSSMQAARIIRTEYNRYNQFVLGKKADAYLRAVDRSESLKNRLRDGEDMRQALELELKKQEDRMRSSEKLLGEAKARRACLGEDALSAKQEQLRQAEEDRARLEGQLERGERLLRQEEETVSRREVKLRLLKQECSEARGMISRSLRELDGQNGILRLDQEHSRYVQELRAERPGAGQDEILAALKLRDGQIRDVLDCMEQVKKAGLAYDEACQALDRAEDEVRAKEAASRNAQAREREERDRLLEDFTRWRDGNARLEIPGELWLELRARLISYKAPADWGAVRDRVDELARQCESALRSKLLRRENDLRIYKEDREALEGQLQQIRYYPDPVPPRGEQVRDTRNILAMWDIPCAPLYELVDFAEGLSQAERDLLEAQLTDSGLLDALIVPHEHLPRIRELLEKYPDRFLLPGPEVSHPLEALVPDGTGQYREDVEACLRSVSRDDLSAETALLPDGRFRCGMIRGRSHPVSPAGFVGAAARAANRQRQIAKLEAQLEQVDAKIAAARSEAERFTNQLAELSQERERMPSAEDLDQAIFMLDQASRDLNLAAKARESCLLAEQAAKTEFKTREEACRSLSHGLPYKLDTPSYEEARDAAREYREILFTLENIRQRLLTALTARDEQEEDIDEQRDRIADMRQANRSTEAMLAERKAAASSLRAFLDRPENRARAQLLAELEQEIRRQDRENRDASEQHAATGEKIKTAQQQIRQLKKDRTDAVLEEQTLEAYFREDLELGLSDLDMSMGLSACAREAAGRVSASDRERTIEDLNFSLQKNFQNQNNMISQYRPEIRLMFDASDSPAHLRQRYCILLKKGGQELSLYGFIQSLNGDIESTREILQDRDRELFENILTETVSQKLRARIEESGKWTRDMTALMSTLTTSMGLTFSLDWKEKKAEGEGEMDTASLVTLLNKDRVLLTQEDSQRVSTHFRTRVRKAKEDADSHGIPVNYADLIRSVLDNRNWYEFRLFYDRGEDAKKELTDRAFNRFSGGEKAMAMYVPLFAAVSAQYQKGAASCPPLLALDEAFAGVDDQNISAMFELMRALDFDYIINSQVLWGCYANVADLDIAEMYHPPGTPVVTILRYHWNGTERTLEGGL